MDFPVFNPASAAILALAEAPERNRPTPLRVPAAQGSQGSETSDKRPDGADARAAQVRDLEALRFEMQQRGLPAGPPPAFQMNLLEAESGMSQAIARIESARGQSRDAPALRPAAADAPGRPDKA